MKGIKPFLVLRYSLIENKQGALVPSPLPKPKGAVVVAALQDDGREFVKNKVRYSFVGFSYAEPTADEFPKGRFLVGKTAKHKLTKVGDKVPGDIVAHDADDWVPVITVVDTVDQYIFVQHDWRFGTDEQIANAIQAGLRDPVLMSLLIQDLLSLSPLGVSFGMLLGLIERSLRLSLNSSLQIF